MYTMGLNRGPKKDQVRRGEHQSITRGEDYPSDHTFRMTEPSEMSIHISYMW